jgi:amino acid adenylation domain-containing protein
VPTVPKISKLNYLEGNDKVSELTIIDLLEESLEANKTNIALVYGATQLTYSELNSRANNISYFLAANGIGPESLVPIYVDSGIDMVAGIIGILKSGGAYVPIDPDYPETRMSYILSDCNADIIVSNSRNSAKLKKIFSGTIIELDKLNYPPTELKKNLHVGLEPDNLAYVIYTSGTTGYPNGVMVEHKSVVNNLLWAKNYLKIGPEDVVLQKTTFCFDVSVWEIFWPLLSGAKLVLINNVHYRDVQILKTAIETHEVTSLHFVPTMLEFFLLSISKDSCSSLKLITSSGEPLTRFQANLLYNKMPNAKLVNLYGPTETTIHSTVWPVPNAPIEKTLIGKPVDNTGVVIINEHGQVQPIGSIGEIYISGIGLARGYLNKPELTFKRFIVGSFGLATNTRFYRTGDFGRYLDDGNIEYLGRVDDQVKINGYRIELGSIESHIKNSGKVDYGVVLTKKNRLRAMQIIAYVVLKAPYNIQDIWDFLIINLPGYMLPTSIKSIESIPFTSNGKVDKDKLFELSLRDNANITIVEPRTEPERTTMSIWSRLFPDIELSIYHDFFEIGGNSMQALQMLSLLKKETGKHISFLLLNQFPTIESLAKLLNKDNIKIPNSLVSIRAEGEKTPLYLINAGELVEDGFFNLGDVLDENQPIFGFQSSGFDSNGRLLDTIEDIAAEYVKGILSQDNYGPYCLAGYSLGGIIAFEMARQLKAMGKDIKILIMVDSLTRDPWLIKTKYTGLNILKLIAFNISMFKSGFSNAFKFGYAQTKAALHALRNKKQVATDAAAAGHQNVNEVEILDNFDLFNLHISAYKKYKIQRYDGNIVIFRAEVKTYFMDDFKYLGWKTYAKRVKSILIKGNHASIFDDEHIEELGNKLQKILDQGF